MQLLADAYMLAMAGARSPARCFFRILELIKLRDLGRVFGCGFRCNVGRIVELCNRSYNGKYRQKRVTALGVQARCVV